MTSSKKILLASDNDGTYHRWFSSPKDLQINNAVMQAFIEEGHDFVLITGRSAPSAFKLIEKEHIPISYVSCMDGGALYTPEKKLLHKNPFTQGFRKDFAFFENKTTARVGYYNTYACEEKPSDPFAIRVESHFTHTILDRIKLGNILKHHPDYMCYTLGNRHYITRRDGKVEAIKTLIERGNYGSIITIGDGPNDKGMLTLDSSIPIPQESYKMVLSFPQLWSQGIKTTFSVAEVAKRYIKG